MDPTVANGVFTLSGAIVGGLIGGIATYFTSKRIVRHQASLTALARLRAAFAPEMARMRKLVSSSGEEVSLDVINALDTKMPEYWRAVEEFRLSIPDEKKEAYDEAWREYWWHGAVAYTNKADIGLYFARLDKLFGFAK